MSLKRTPLRQRLVVAFVLLTAVVSGLFALFTFVAIEQLEEDLFVRQLDGELLWWINHLGNAPQPRPVELPNHAHLYITPDLFDVQLPAFLPAVGVGSLEVVDDKDSYQVLRRDLGNRRYYLVQPTTAQEKRESTWFAVLAIGTVLAWLFAYAIARLTANNVLEPVLRLAQRVRQADVEHPLPRLAEDYADDEIGDLAQAFARRLEELHGFIASERLFTSDVSHELRTPLAIIAGAAETLLERSVLPPRARNAAQRIHTAAQEMQDLIDAFLALGRQPTDPIADHPLCAVNDLVRAQIERARAQAPPGAPDVMFIEEATVNLPCPAALLTVAVRNLLDNALRYAPGGDVRVTLRADALQVDDNGPGLTPDDLDQAFDRHWRHAPTTPGGEGLGLAIVRRICTRSGWQVQAQSGPHGLRVLLRFSP